MRALQSRDGDVVQAFSRGLSVIRAFDVEEPHLTLSDVARRAQVSRATARRLLHTLMAEGYVRQDDNLFSLRPRVLELGYSYLSPLKLPDLALPHLKALAGQVQESAYLSIVDGDENICIASAPVRRIWSMVMTVGTVLPAYATASGRVIIASWAQAEVNAMLSTLKMEKITPQTITSQAGFKRELVTIRERGWARVDEELEEGLRTVAVPIHSGGKTVASLSVSTPVRGADSRRDRLMEFLTPMFAAAAALDDDLEAVSRSPIQTG